VARFLALYRGESVTGARLIALSSEPSIVDRFIRELAGEGEEERDNAERQSLHVVSGDDE